MAFRVALDTFRGPLDLLLYLVQKQEVEITEISLADVTEQFVEHLSVLQELDFDSVGDFLDVAGRLVELKSRSVLPNDEEDDDSIDTSTDDLVQDLLAYKAFRDAASALEEQAHDWQQRFSRRVKDLPPRRTDPADQPIKQTELWDLVSAFNRILERSERNEPASITYDDTPVSTYMQRIHDRLCQNGSQEFEALFPPAAHKSVLVGTFLAILELMRRGHAVVLQEELFGKITLRLSDSQAPLDLQEVESYAHGE